MKIDIADIVPDGVLPGDHLHRETWDETCSRCRRDISEDRQVPILLWMNDGTDLYAFCDRCCRPDIRRCRECGCTDDAACDDGWEPCGWALPDLCTACSPVRAVEGVRYEGVRYTECSGGGSDGGGSSQHEG